MDEQQQQRASSGPFSLPLPPALPPLLPPGSDLPVSAASIGAVSRLPLLLCCSPSIPHECCKRDHRQMQMHACTHAHADGPSSRPHCAESLLAAVAAAVAGSCSVKRYCRVSRREEQARCLFLCVRCASSVLVRCCSGADAAFLRSCLASLVSSSPHLPPLSRHVGSRTAILRECGQMSQVQHIIQPIQSQASLQVRRRD